MPKLEEFYTIVEADGEKKGGFRVKQLDLYIQSTAIRIECNESGSLRITASEAGGTWKIVGFVQS